MLCFFSVDLKLGGNTGYNIDQGFSNWGPGTSRGPQGSDRGSVEKFRDFFF